MENLGKYVIVRSNGAGVLFGILKEKNGNELTLTNVRKLYRWSGANTVEDISVKGVKNPDGCKFTIEVSSMTVKDFEQILPCEEEAINNIKNVQVWSY